MKMPTYWFKVRPEVVRFVGVVLATYLLSFLAEHDVLAATDWRRLALAFAVGLAQALATAFLAQTGPGGFKP